MQINWMVDEWFACVRINVEKKKGSMTHHMITSLKI